MNELGNIAHYVNEKIKVSDIKFTDYVSTDNMLPYKEGITETVSFPVGGSVTRFRAGDVLVSNIRPYFKKIWFADKDGGCSNDVLVFRLNNAEETDPRFLYYLLLQDVFFDYMMAGANGTKMPRGNKNLLPHFLVPDYDVVTKRKIVSVLSVYDKLIENYRRQIKLLEEAAHRLYKEWFVDLHFPDSENTQMVNGLPVGWSSVNLVELIDYEIGGGWGNDKQNNEYSEGAYVIRATDFHCVYDGSIKSVPYRFHTISNLKSRELQDGDIVFEVSGGSKTEGAGRSVFISNILLQHLDAPVICASFCKLVRAKERSISKYLFDTLQYLRRTEATRIFDKYSAGNIVNYRWQDFLELQQIVVPEEDVLKAYTKISENLFSQVQILAKQISVAKEARDLLLPRLMSGEINVE